MRTEHDAHDPIDPRTAQDLFLKHKATECAEKTVQVHRYRTTPSPGGATRIIDWSQYAAITATLGRPCSNSYPTSYGDPTTAMISGASYTR